MNHLRKLRTTKNKLILPTSVNCSCWRPRQRTLPLLARTPTDSVIFNHLRNLRATQTKLDFALPNPVGEGANRQHYIYLNLIS